MLNVFAIIAPIYLLIGAGFVMVRAGWMQGADMRVLGRFVAQFCVPALLFRAVTRQPVGEVLQLDFLLVYAAGSLLTIALVLFVARLRGAQRPLAAVQALGAAGSNSVFVGYPLALQLLGPTAGVALALTTLVENLLVIPLLLALAASASGDRGVGPMLRTTARALLRNPMILAIAAGVVVSALDLQLHPVLERTVGLAAAAAAPTALFVIGGTLVGIRLAGIRTDLVLVAVGKLVLHPLLVLLFVWLVAPADPLLRGAAVIFAAVPMLSIYPVLAQRYGHERFAAAAMLATTLLSFATISLLIMLLPAHWIAAR